MAIKRHLLTLEEDTKTLYVLAIHSESEDYQLAFQLNKHCNTSFKRSKDDISNSQNVLFSRFIWEDLAYDTQYALLSNKKQIESPAIAINSTALFDLPVRNQVSLFPEFKQVDFFIVSNDQTAIERLFESLKLLPIVSTAYPVSVAQFKNRSHLIFES